MLAKVIPVELRHVAGVQAAVASVARERLYLATTTGYSLAETARFVGECIEKNQPMLVAVEGTGRNEKVVGWCDVRRNPWPGREHVGQLGIGVIADYRGIGLGERLLEDCITAAWAAGFERLELNVRKPNKVAQSLYEKLGFVQEGHRRDVVRIDGHSIDDVHMALLKGAL